MNDLLGSAVSKPIRYLFRRNGAEIVYNKLVAPYFAQTKPKLALAAIAAMNGTTLGGAVYCNYLWRDITNHLAARDITALTHDATSFSGFVAGFVGISIARSLITQNLKLSWSNWAKEQAVKEWLSVKNRHGLVTRSAELSPEQRIPMDIATFIHASEPLTVGFMSNLANFGAFSSVLFTLSPAAYGGTLALGAAGTWLIHRNGKNLTKLNDETAAAQNAFRNEIAHAKDNQQSIALWGGENAAQKSIGERLDDLNQVSQKTIHTNVRLDAIRNGYANIGMVVPYVAVAPAYFAPGSKMGIGDLSLLYSASYNTRSCLDWYSMSQQTIVDWKAGVKRLTTFLENCSTDLASSNKTPTYLPNRELGVSVKDLVLRKPANGAPTDDDILCRAISFDLKPGDRLAITGPSGCGKSTLFNVLGRLSPHDSGEINFSGVSEEPGDVIFVPLKTYIADVPLQEVLTFPKTDGISEEAMKTALEKVGLAHIIPHVGDPDFKCHQLKLSDGQKQRLNFARLLLHKPKIIGLDEATANLDAGAGIEMHKLLFSELPNSIIISVSHREELIPLHTHLGEFTNEALTVKPIAVKGISLDGHLKNQPPGNEPSPMPTARPIIPLFKEGRFGPHLAKS